MEASQLKQWFQTMSLVAYARPSPDVLEFTVIPKDGASDLPRLPPFVAREVMAALTETAVVTRIVVTELGTHGLGTMVSLIVPPAGAAVGAMQESE